MKAKKIILIVIGILFIAAIAAFFILRLGKRANYSEEVLEKSKTENFVTAMPFDITQLVSMSKFRSCAGHDYSGKNILGEEEKLRSMKHYVEMAKDGQNKVGIHAPFDGKVVDNSVGKNGDNLTISPDSAPGWMYEIGHVESIKSLVEGTSVKAGDVIGYVVDRPGSQYGFDSQLYFGGNDLTTNAGTGATFDSIFAHAIDSVKSELEQYGLPLDKLIIPKAERDAKPCKVNGDNNGDANFQGNMEEDYAKVTKED